MQVSEYTNKIKQLLESEDQANQALAFQLMEGQGVPKALYRLMGNDFYKQTLCVQHGIVSPIQNINSFHLSGDHQPPSGYVFEHFPKALLALDELRELTFTQHQFTQLLPIENAWRVLEKLDLSLNQLTQLPQDFGNLGKLQEFSLANNQVLSLPESIKKCKQLKVLQLGGNQLRTFPNDILSLNKLEKLDLQNNFIAEIPSGINKLKKLKELNLSGNRLRNLPTQIARIKHLETICLSRNQFEEIPKVLYQAENLVCLEIKDNPMEPEKIEEAQRLFQFKLTMMIFLLGKKYK